MIRFIIILATCLLCVQCVSLKKYRALEEDYQRCGESQRSYEQLRKIQETDKQNERKKEEY